ncbi:MAG TPA: hypothetical protein VMS93_01865, partial [Candidatus Saccharimonadales bacterium]|nr:hypothetical protein [Candidatus Saccharimonadales bacterium]
MNPRAARQIASALATGLVLLVGGCGTQEFQSRPLQAPVTVDGSDADWKGALTYVEDLKIFVGARNDSRNLYLCFECADRATARQVLMAGLTLWFDPEGGQKETFGIHYPLGLQASGMPMPAGDPEGDDRGEGGGRWGRGSRTGPGDREASDSSGGGDRGAGRERGGMLRQALREIEILGPGKYDRHRSAVSQLPGIQVAAGNLEGAAIYEIKVPLAALDSMPYAIGTRPGALVGVGLKSGKLEFQRPRGGGGRGRGR